MSKAIPAEHDALIPHLVCERCGDAIEFYKKAFGATVRMPPMDMFWGDRYGMVVDPFGHQWSIATHQRDLTPQQIEKNMKEAFAHAHA